jgi:hypothetical protein
MVTYQKTLVRFNLMPIVTLLFQTMKAQDSSNGFETADTFTFLITPYTGITVLNLSELTLRIGF